MIESALTCNLFGMPRIFPSEILIATKNAGKVAELRELFTGVPIKFKYLHDFPEIADVAETGTTFEQNAVLKAAGYARRTGISAIADDSGLEIEFLDGAPGVYSARYGGEDLSFSEKMVLILAQMKNAESRRARFSCVMVLAGSEGETLCSAEGVCMGSIAESPLGAGGFGYDPIFIPDGFGTTFGQLPPAVKQQISHRGRAAMLIRRYLLHFNAV